MTQIQNHSSSQEGAEDIASSHAPVEAAQARHLPSLWRNRDFMLLWSGQLVSNVGSQVSLLAFPLLALAGALLQAFGPVVTVWITFVPQVAVAVAVMVNRSMKEKQQ